MNGSATARWSLPGPTRCRTSRLRALARPQGGGRTRRSRERSRAGRLWLGQALTGALLLLFLAVHLVAQHILAPAGLRDHAAVLAYLSQPVALAAEIGLLASVIVHACLGMRSSLVDVLGDVGLSGVPPA